MTIELSKDAKQAAIASIQHYFEANMEEKIANIATGALLGFFLEELAPRTYTQGAADASPVKAWLRRAGKFPARQLRLCHQRQTGRAVSQNTFVDRARLVQIRVDSRVLG